MISTLIRALQGAPTTAEDGVPPRADAWVGAVSAALVAIENRRDADSKTALWAERVGSRKPVAGLRLDLSHLERLIVQAVVELPAGDRDLVLGRYREQLSLDDLARPLGLRRRALLAHLTDVLEQVGDRVRAGCGGSTAVYRAALQASAAARDERRGRRREPLRWVAVAAACLLIAIVARRAVGDRELPASSDEVVAVERDRQATLGTSPAVSNPGASPAATATPADSLVELSAREFDDVLLRGRVTLIGGPASGFERRNLGQVRASSEGREQIALVDAQGRFSVAGLSTGTWRVSLRLPGYETLDTEVAIEAGVRPPLLLLEAHAAQEVDVQLIDSEGRGLFESAGLADDWTVTHGLTVWLGRTPPAERVDPVGAGTRPWEQLGSFERFDPIDMARPEAFGRLLVERPRALRWAALLYGDRVIGVEPWQPGDPVLRFDVDPGRLATLRSSVRILLQSLLGLDVTGAEVRLIGPNGEVRVLKVGEDGTLRIDGLPPGRWEIEIRLQGHGTLRRTLELDPGGEGQSEDYELSAPLRVTGQVKNLAGLPVGVDVRAVDLDLLIDPWSFEAQPNTSSSQFAAGTFSFNDLSSDGSWVLVLEHPDFALTAYEVSSDQSHQDLQLQATPGQDVTLSWGAADVGGDRLMLLRDANGLPLKVLMPTSDLAASIKLAPGSYFLNLWESGVWGKELTIDVAGGSNQVGVTW